MITIKVTGIEPLVKDYSAFKAELSDMKEPMMESTQYYLKEVDKNFTDHGKTFNKPWVPLSEFTLRRKEADMKKGRAISLDPLIRTGKMMMGFNALVKTRYGQLFNTREYAQVHQEGGTAKAFGKVVNVPQRILADVDDTRERQVSKIFEAWLGRLVNRHKL